MKLQRCLEGVTWGSVLHLALLLELLQTCTSKRPSGFFNLQQTLCWWGCGPLCSQGKRDQYRVIPSGSSTPLPKP